TTQATRNSSRRAAVSFAAYVGVDGKPKRLPPALKYRQYSNVVRLLPVPTTARTGWSDLSRMKGNFHVRFSEGGGLVTARLYSASVERGSVERAAQVTDCKGQSRTFRPQGVLALCQGLTQDRNRPM